MHDEKKIEEMNQYLKAYKEPTQLNGTDYYLIPMQKIEHDRKQYAEHMLQQERGRIITEAKKLFEDENPVDCIDGETPVETYGYEATFNNGIKAIINLINKENE